MASDLQGEESLRNNQPQPDAEIGPFVLRTLLQDVPLSAEGGGEDIKINCVDYLGAHYMAVVDEARRH
jgi:vacuolar protein sorting-associated protein 3